MILEILNDLKNQIESIVPIPNEYTVSRGNENGFEKLVPEILENMRINGPNDFEYVVHMGHHFPDIDIIVDENKFGLELKSRNNATWSTNGNSVFESITGSEYTEIYLLFGSFYSKDAQIKVRYAPYWSVTTSINVTHSPRFSINMDATDSVFESSASYELLRNSTDDEKVSFIQDYLRENTNGSKWYISQQENEIAPINIYQIGKENTNRIIVEIFLLYPQDIFRTYNKETIRSNYSRASAYIISTYFYYSPSFRDLFSAGGRWMFNDVSLPQVFMRLRENKETFNMIFKEANPEFIDKCYESWAELGVYVLSDNFKKSYFNVLDYLGQSRFPNLVEGLPNMRLSSLLQ